jgi:hypothetical protein
MEPAAGPILHHRQAAGPLLHNQGQVTSVPTQRGGVVGGESPQVGKGHPSTGGLLLQQKGGGALAEHKAGQPLPIAAQGRVLAVLHLAQGPCGSSGTAGLPWREGTALARGQEGQKCQQTRQAVVGKVPSFGVDQISRRNGKNCP